MLLILLFHNHHPFASSSQGGETEAHKTETQLSALNPHPKMYQYPEKISIKLQLEWISTHFNNSFSFKAGLFKHYIQKFHCATFDFNKMQYICTGWTLLQCIKLYNQHLLVYFFSSRFIKPTFFVHVIKWKLEDLVQWIHYQLIKDDLLVFYVSHAHFYKCLEYLVDLSQAINGSQIAGVSMKESCHFSDDIDCLLIPNEI